MAEDNKLRIIAKVAFKSFCIGLSAFFLILFSGVRLYPASQENTSEIRVNGITPLHKMSKENILSLRRARVEEHRGLGIFPPDYRPSGSIFGEIDENADWVNDTQFFVNNPYLLALTSAGEMVNPLLSFCNVESVRYANRRIEALYAGGSSSKWFFYLYDYYPGNNGVVRLWLVNAHDAGFRYALVDSERSTNIDTGWPGSGDSIIKGVHEGREFFHVGHLSKNNISPNDDRLKLRLLRRDAKTVIYIKLWRYRPADMVSKEDFSYIIRIEP